MLKFFFNRDSWMVTVMELVGLTAYGIFIYRSWTHFGFLGFALSFIVLCYLFIRLCDVIPWHGAKKRTVGVRVHFQKAIVPTSYILAVTAMLSLFPVPILSAALVILAVLMMLVVTPVNGILVYFYFKDKDPLPVNHFSGNHYLKDDGKIPYEKIPASAR